MASGAGKPAATSVADNTRNGFGGLARSSLHDAHGQLFRKVRHSTNVLTPSDQSIRSPSPSRRNAVGVGAAVTSNLRNSDTLSIGVAAENNDRVASGGMESATQDVCVLPGCRTMREIGFIYRTSGMDRNDLFRGMENRFKRKSHSTCVWKMESMSSCRVRVSRKDHPSVEPITFETSRIADHVIVSSRR